MEENIIGGVSPLKWKGRRGKSSGKGRRGTGDTRYKRDKWQKPTSGGTTTLTPKRKAGELPPPPQKPYKIVDGKVVPNVYNTYNYGDNTINQSNNPGSKTTTKTTPGADAVYGTKKGRLPTYQEAWDANKEDIKNKYESFEDYKADMISIKKGDKRDIEREEARKKAEKETEVVVKEAIPATNETIEEILPGSGNNTQTATIKQIINGEEVETSATPMLGSPGKYRLGGYRAMKKNRK